MASIDQVYQQIVGFTRDRGVRKVTLFGSRARGDALPKSDIDLAVEDCDDFPGFKEDIEERLWSLLNVDVVNLDGTVSDALRDDIARDGKVLYAAV